MIGIVPVEGSITRRDNRVSQPGPRLAARFFAHIATARPILD
jgi:hypothetical protein